MPHSPIWSSLALLSAMFAPSFAAADTVAVTDPEDWQLPGQEPPVAVTAYFTNPQDCQSAELFVTATIAPGYWLYSIAAPWRPAPYDHRIAGVA